MCSVSLTTRQDLYDFVIYYILFSFCALFTLIVLHEAEYDNDYEDYLPQPHHRVQS